MQDHIAFRSIEEREAYLPGTGLGVWEVAWIAREFGGDVDRTAAQLGIDCALVRAALDYAAEHHAEIEKQIHDHVLWTADDVEGLLPRAHAIPPDPRAADISSS